ncbi:MAG TPA: L-threonylcarbamoyladenylate synthase [Alphaproteobacteria bacterium]|nr:L-threonylcarbamoyladenylate synthase [Alphaproteobacteria bacterium]
MIVKTCSEHLEEAIRILSQGDLIGLPTETVYGLAADATQELAVAKIFQLKNRPTFNPLIIHGHSNDCFKEHVIWNEEAEALARTFWPGPLTLVLPRLPSSSLSLLASAGLDSLAVRIPRHPLALNLLQEFGRPLAAPSANPSGKTSPTQAIHVEEDFPNLFILDGGDTTVGLESTIIDLTGPFPHLLRPGGISQEEIESVIGPLKATLQESIKAPGMMKSHYAPTLPLHLNVTAPAEGEAYLAFGPTSHKGEHVLNLSEDGNLTEAAANLFKMMRILDRTNFHRMSVAPIPLRGLGIALNDRLQRAAAPRGPLGKE